MHSFPSASYQRQQFVPDEDTGSSMTHWRHGHSVGMSMICLVVAAALPTPGAIAEDYVDVGSVPSWAETGRFRYARWDGGILDVSKGILSGWPAWREPDQLLAVAEWYERRNVELLELAQVNWIWVTFSNGFSLSSEFPHQVRLREFISECQRHGVHVTAYMSIANVFYEDMFARESRSKEWIAVSKDSQPIPYRAANYTGFASNTRYLACLQHPEWRAYLKQRIVRAVAAGCEGIVWDNAVIERCYCPRCEANFASWREQVGAPSESMAWTTYYREMLSALVTDLHMYALELKPTFLMYVNANRGLYTLNRAGNAVSSEDGTEPGLDADGKVVSNIGLLRYQWAIGEGWRPVRMEYSGRLRTGPFESRFTIPMTPRSHQLAIAEAAAHHVGFEIFSLGQFQRDLFLRDPAALANLRAAGCYNAFLMQNEDLYVKPHSMARIALLANGDDRQVQASVELANRGVIFDVVFTAGLTKEKLDRYDVVIAPDVRYLSDEQLGLLALRVGCGGRLVISGQTGDWDERLQKRERVPLSCWFQLTEDQSQEPRSIDTGNSGGLVNCGPAMDWDWLANSLAEWDVSPLVRLDAPSTVRVNVHGQEFSSRCIVHLLNYAPEPVQNLSVRVNFPAADVAILTPDNVPMGSVEFEVTEGGTRFIVPELDTYDVVVVQPQGEENDIP